MQHSKSLNSDGETLFGAKITGGGSGGTICVMGKNISRSGQQILKVTSKSCYVFTTYLSHCDCDAKALDLP